MKFSINQKELENVLNTVSRGVAANASMQSLAGVYMEAVENEIVVRSTNLELSIQVSCPALIEEEGKALLPAKLLSNIVKTLPNEAVSIETNAQEAEIICGMSNFKIRVYSAQDFPEFPQVEATQSVELPFKEFSEMSKKVARMVSKDESRAILTGVLVTVKDGNLKMVAIDGYRVIVAKSNAKVDSKTDFEAVIPGSFLVDAANISDNAEAIKISLSNNQIVVSCSETVFVNRRIEGTFPAYQQFFADSYAVKAQMNTKTLADAVRRIAVLSAANPIVKFTLDPSNNVILLSGAEQDVGSGTESIECQYAPDSEVEPVEISFNCNFVLEGVSCINTETLSLEVQESIKPGVFCDETEHDLTYLLLAVKA